MLKAQQTRDDGNMGSGFYYLFNAVQAAALTEIQLGQYAHEHKNVKKDNTAFDQMARLASVELPTAFGRLIANTDLQNAFLSLGRYVRCFEDAAYVLDKLQPLMEDRLNTNEEAHINGAITQLIDCAEQYTKLFSMLE
jgi:hypothetical protein